jgi:hypothetical protein
MVSAPHAAPCTSVSTEQRGVAHAKVVVVVDPPPDASVVDVVETGPPAALTEMSAQWW